MSREYFIWCLLSLLYFNGVVTQVPDDDDFDGGIDIEGAVQSQIAIFTEGLQNKLNATEIKITNLENDIKRNNDYVEKLPETLEKINQRLDALEKDKTSDEIKNKLATLESKILNLEEQINRDVIEKNNLSQRLNVLENSPRVSRSPSTERITEVNRESTNLESTIDEVKKDFIESNKAFNEIVMKDARTELDDLDKSMINSTGCKYLSLKKEDFQIFYMENQTMSLINSAYQQLSTYRNIRLPDFESHLAIRSSGDLYILLWEDARPDFSNIGPDYEIGLGVTGRNRNVVVMSSFKTKLNFWKDSTPTAAMSPTEYKKFYIKVYHDTLEFGTGCGDAPIHIHNIYGKSKIKTIGFMTMSNDGAKILLDCPATYCADSRT